MLSAIVRRKLQHNYHCLYVNSEPMVAAMGSYLSAAGVDLEKEIARRSLTLSSERQHLIDGRHFDIDRMIGSLEGALNQALKDGFKGLWASGDMTWEFGPEDDFSKLIEYEWRLEEFFHAHPQISGVCQYHAETLPRKVIREGLLVHPGLFINETLSIINPHYLHPAEFPLDYGNLPEVESALRLFNSEPIN
jgi:hypothetical protein